mmetsp:Transcript_6253/g.15929  ORF Transcript_6253/g.15929 Transcript_6253/m.15929 type:complete len:423 (-) Transcript_6253:1199-2467(-)
MKAARRKTLSAVDASQLNTRLQGLTGDANSETTFSKSLACASSVDLSISKQTVASSRPLSRSHQGKPSSSQRRHSMFFSSQTPRVDPRPLGDKSYTSSCIRQLISFLSSHGFDSVLSPKTLAAPTTKDFAALSLFIFRQTDQNFKFGSKTEDDVPAVFKQLRYPFQISKSALYAVGSPHTWPSLLTALTWLVQMHVYEEEARRSEAKMLYVEPAVYFFKYVSTSYRYFLAGDDAKCEELEREFTTEQHKKSTESNVSTLQLEQENCELEVLLASLARESPQKSAFQSEKESFVRGVHKYEDNLGVMKIFTDEAEQHSTHARKTINVHEHHFPASHYDLNCLNQRISTQSIDVAKAIFTVGTSNVCNARLPDDFDCVLCLPILIWRFTAARLTGRRNSETERVFDVNKVAPSKCGVVCVYGRI